MGGANKVRVETWAESGSWWRRKVAAPDLRGSKRATLSPPSHPSPGSLGELLWFLESHGSKSTHATALVGCARLSLGLQDTCMTRCALSTWRDTWPGESPPQSGTWLLSGAQDARASLHTHCAQGFIWSLSAGLSDWRIRISVGGGVPIGTLGAWSSYASSQRFWFSFTQRPGCLWHQGPREPCTLRASGLPCTFSPPIDWGSW